MNGDDDFQLDLDALGRSCRCSVELIVELVHEGAIEPQGASQGDWRFGSAALQRARRAVRLAQDLELDSSGVALALELLDQIERLKAALASRG